MSFLTNPHRFSVPFVPTDIAGLLGWYKPETLLMGDGAAVSQWDDSSGNSNHLVQATGSMQPTKRVNQLSGFATVQFDGGDVLQRAGFTLTQAFTLFAVCRNTTGAGIQSPLDHDTGSPRMFQFRYNGASTFELVSWSPGATIDSQPITAANYSIISAVRRAAEGQVYVNGASNGSTAAPGTANGPSTSTLTMGGRGSSNFLTGFIFEVLIYNSALSDANRQSVQNYLSTRTAIAVS